LGNDLDQLSLAEAAARFLATLDSEERTASQSEVNNFVRWFGSQRQIAALTPAEIEKFAERLSQSDTDHTGKLERVRAFLTAAKKAKWTNGNLATNLKLRKTKARSRTTRKLPVSESVSLTRDGYTKLDAELAELRDRRLLIIEDIRRAAADKDFRENVPFHAAREEKGHIDGRIMELEATLKSATIMDAAPDTSLHITIGHTVLLCDLSTGEECRYMLVNPREVDLARGRISSASPIGRAVMGKSQGETAEVTAPAGKVRFEIKKVER
jgi:transcription elongation factor GreA